jgi:hypothetical protein
MKVKTWQLLVAALLLVVTSYQIGKYAGENSAKSRVREQELSFQKEKEATRKAEFAKLLRMKEEQKRADEKRLEQAKIEEREMELAKFLMESKDRQHAILMKYLDTMRQIPVGISPRRPELSESIINYYLAFLAANPSVKIPPPSAHEPRLSSETVTASARESTSISIPGTITGISYNSDNPIALIGNTIVHIGDTINGAKVVDIQKNIVHFEKDGKTWTAGIGETP